MTADILRLKIEAALFEGEAHRLRLCTGAKKLAPFFPLTPDSLNALEDETVSWLDQFIYRFTKLQDAMGTRLFPALAFMISGNDEPRPFLDTLNMLEKIGVVSSVEEWQTLRAARNNLAHEYPGSDEQRSAILNILFLEWRKLESMFMAAQSYYEEKLLPLLDRKR
ncbi:MAG: hypothetical protein K0B01_14090 [Syntrophobacterales bacterium]|nr:hypothetical protein [Syntrophobacterales bacterium]